ncbi:VOC family protein [Sphingobacterium pedocola]|uniref:VOC family protein n=1 Tax=Sphingobacterium pedocola TaxID=2082722 RepID=A0ABR9TAZ5_9SPHI|nr:VOC family protein [Sphingobacterium pedocola]MBE8722537.1 VOC family protein [Sphingobacterium pedocola]
MTKVHAYLNFNGNCEEAFKFYEQVFNKENTGFYRFGDMPSDPEYPLPEEAKNLVSHTSIALNESTMLMGSDCFEGFGQKATQGTNTYIMLDTDTPEEATALHAALSVDAQNIEMPLGEQFWAELFSSFTDKYGISWMIHFEGNKKM